MQQRGCRERAICNRRQPRRRERSRFHGILVRHGACFPVPAGGYMTDLLLVLATAAFFALSWGYARICEKL